jgi:hypothetical protein
LESIERDTIEKVRLISGSTSEQSKDFFESFITYIVLNYMEGKETIVPYLGVIKLNYEGDEIVKNGKEAKVSLEFIPNSNIKKIVGQIADGEETEIEQSFFKKIKYQLEEIVNIKE